MAAGGGLGAADRLLGRFRRLRGSLGEERLAMTKPVRACCGQVSRRTFLADTGMGFTGLALGATLFRDGIVRGGALDGPGTGPKSGPHLPPKAKSVIWIFLCGGVSHMESFDIKPELNKYGGKSIDDTPYKDFLDEKRINQNLVGINPGHYQRRELMPLQTVRGMRSGSGGLVPACRPASRRSGRCPVAVDDP
jgi:hypothetical protein